LRIFENGIKVKTTGHFYK